MKKREVKLKQVTERRNSVDALFARVQGGKAFALHAPSLLQFLEGGTFPSSSHAHMVQKFDGSEPV